MLLKTLHPRLVGVGNNEIRCNLYFKLLIFSHNAPQQATYLQMIDTGQWIQHANLMPQSLHINKTT